MVAVTSDAYLGLWQHLLNHDIARRVIVDAPLDDPFPDLVDCPWKLELQRGEGAMIRVVDVEQAIAMRPYCGDRPVSFTMRITDPSASWNDGVWRVEAAEGRMQAQAASDEADIELSVNFLAPLFTGLVRPDVAAGMGMVRVNNEAALGGVTAAFSTTYPPYCNDYY
jgi:predicted acetyltransferase